MNLDDLKFQIIYFYKDCADANLEFSSFSYRPLAFGPELILGHQCGIFEFFFGFFKIET